MLDLETMGTSANAPIIAIGAVSFDRDGVYDEFYQQISLADNMLHGRKPDASTIIWWLQQSDDARAAFAQNNHSHQLDITLMAFTDWFNLGRLVEVWGNGASFDNAILADAYRSVGLEQPWKFWNDRCYRTVKEMHRHVKLERVGTHHNALDDARSQALHLIKMGVL